MEPQMELQQFIQWTPLILLSIVRDNCYCPRDIFNLCNDFLKSDEEFEFNDLHNSTNIPIDRVNLVLKVLNNSKHHHISINDVNFVLNNLIKNRTIIINKGKYEINQS